MNTELNGTVLDREGEMTQFDRRASLILPYFNHDIRYGKHIVPPPIMVELFGVPSSGKSTAIREADKTLRKQQFRVKPPSEGAESIRYLTRDTPSYNIATGMYSYDILLEESEGHRYDYVLFDRCLFDAYTWMKYWYRKGKLTDDLLRSIQEYFLYGAARIDLAILVVCDPEIAFKRETRFETTKRMGNYTNPETMELLLKLNMESHKELEKRFPQLKLLDTTNLDEVSMVHAVENMIYTCTEDKIVERKR